MYCIMEGGYTLYHNICNNSIYCKYYIVIKIIIISNNLNSNTKIIKSNTKYSYKNTTHKKTQTYKSIR